VGLGEFVRFGNLGCGMRFSVKTGVGALAFATGAGVLPLATGAGAALTLTVLAAAFFAADLVAAAGFLTNEILRIIMSSKPVCTLIWKTCKPMDVEMSRRATWMRENYSEERRRMLAGISMRTPDRRSDASGPQIFNPRRVSFAMLGRLYFSVRSCDTKSYATKLCSTRTGVARRTPRSICA
jgi:hypothetical protein